MYNDFFSRYYILIFQLPEYNYKRKFSSMLASRGILYLPTHTWSNTSLGEWHSNIFSEIETMVEMHSVIIKIITEQIFCLVNMSFITKFVIFNLKTVSNFRWWKDSSRQEMARFPLQFSLALFFSIEETDAIFNAFLIGSERIRDPIVMGPPPLDHVFCPL